MDPEFVDGLIVKGPRAGAPDFVKGSLSIRVAELIVWLQVRQQKAEQEDNGWINIDIKESRNGKWYAQVNTWKPDPNRSNGGSASSTASDAAQQPSAAQQQAASMDVDPNDIPF